MAVPARADDEPDDEPEGDPALDGWETAELIAKLDPRVAARMLAQHPVDGWCWRCRTEAPCSTRILGQAVNRAIWRLRRRS